MAQVLHLYDCNLTVIERRKDVSLHNNPVAQAKGINPAVYNAIKSASQKTGVSFDYLLDQARTESNFQTDIKAKTSSATGLYQFINSTWMTMIEKHGEKYGLDTSKDKQEILDLRKDPKIASYMAAEFAKENSNHLENTVGGQIGQTDLYLAHFLGAGGAEKFLKNWHTNPQQPADAVFPTAAKANKNVFYDKATGKTRSLDEVYQFFANKFNEGTDSKQNTQIAVVNESNVTTPVTPLQNDLVQTRPSAIQRLASTADINRDLSRLVPKASLPVLSPYTNMILAALDVPRGNGKGEGTVWFKGGGFGSDGANSIF